MLQNPALRPSNPLNNIGQMMRTIQSAQNPRAMLQTMMAQNPQLMQAASIAQSMNTDPKTAFYKLAAQRGVNGDALINDLMKQLNG